MLAGRDALLAELDALLMAGDSPTPRTVALCGQGGAGKTSVAVAYAHRHLAEVGVAWQFEAGNSTVLAAGFAELAAQLGARGVADTRDPVASVHAVLARFPAPWLLIFDDASDLGSVAAFVPKAGHGQVLITSQNPSWPGQALDVPVLDPEAAARFLVDRTGDPDGPTATALAGELGGLPLALEQAAAYILASGNTLANYLALFQHRRAELLASGEPTGYDKTVATTWSLAFDYLKQTGPGAVGLLRLLACCAPEPIPLRLLMQGPHRWTSRVPIRVARVLFPLLTNPVAAGDAIAALRRYSLIGPGIGGSFTMHRLVQAVTRDQMPTKIARQWQQATAALVRAAFPEDPSQSDTWPDFAALLPHAQATLDPRSNGLQRMGAYLQFSGNYVAACQLYRKWLDERVNVLRAKHPDILATRVNLAGATAQAGDPATARDLLSELLPVMEEVLGPKHPETLSARNDLVLMIGQAGDPATARDLLSELLPVMEQVLGQEHQYTLMARNELARFTGQAGDPATARDLLSELLSEVEQILGPEHPGTLAFRSNLADWTGQAGDPVAARDLLSELLPVTERVFGGKEHPLSLTVQKEFASWTGQAGDPATARDLLNELLPVMERVLGAEHRDTLAAQKELARWSGRADNAAAAEANGRG